ncbi:succinylglutamate desuccinylase/aspartoacylase family protein [Aquimarina agarivorans]|uniref:succinylglutamate desuccinylase/aspartoacylase family protein n=1 Tax=Aquimarina agarivorans TaxID=980584 RepID=UPI000248E723|nr:succinylglutamate desuccinylase/aspartoacylase family protein [Aquimarina agarivorans]
MKALYLVVLFLSQVSIAQSEFQKAIASNLKPSRVNLNIKFADSMGNTSNLPIAVLKGKSDGPIFTIVAGIHGFEYPPIVATQALLSEINIEQLHGTLIVIPIANTASFYNRSPFVNPQDDKNLNNAFPGKKNGSITEQIAHFITTEIIAATDVFLDVHGGDACEDLIPFVCYYNNIQKKEKTALARKLSEKSGFELIVSYPYTISNTDPAKYAFKQAVQHGKTALSIECGKLGNVQQENVALIKSGVYNMLATLNMYAEGNGPHKNIIRSNSQSYIKSKAKGIFYSTHKAGDAVKKDEIVGYTTDEFGKIIEEYKAPTNGLILYKLATPPINISDTVMCIGAYADADDE